jgi:pimeloyl-ACP methyl ester carboxylesterase/DNA-binding CsgD family transcriptional regulator
MAAQRIRFCKTSDGVRIAYATVGSGPPLVYATGWPVHLEIEWEKPFVRRFLEALAKGVTLIRYDMRGSGLSDEEVSDFSPAALMRDLEAVIDHLGLERFALLSLGDMAGPLTMTYAARHPDRVTHLILNSSWLRGSELGPPERQQALIDYTANFGYPIFELLDTPGINVQQQLDIRQINEVAASPKVQAEVLRATYAADVSDVVSMVCVPTLVLHARGDPLVPFHLGRELATQLPNAEFVPYEGSTAVPWVISGLLVREIHEFLGVSSRMPASEERRPAPGEVLAGQLTSREVEVLALVAAGLSSRDIGQELTLSVRTVERHISNVYSKLRINSRVQATAYALERGLVSAHAALRSSRRHSSPENA